MAAEQRFFLTLQMCVATRKTAEVVISTILPLVLFEVNT